MNAFATRYLAALEFKDYRWLWLAAMSGASAYWALIVARGVLVLEMSGSSGMVGIVTFAAMAPRFIIPPIAGYLADRFNRQTVLATVYWINTGYDERPVRRCAAHGSESKAPWEGWDGGTSTAVVLRKSRPIGTTEESDTTADEHARRWLTLPPS